MTKEQPLPGLQTILDVKLVNQLPEEERPNFRITVRNTEGDHVEVIKDLKLASYEEHYMNGLKKVIFSFSHVKRGIEEYEWQPLASTGDTDSVVTDITIHWQGDKPRLSEEKLKRFLMLLPKEFDREEIDSVAKTNLHDEE